MRLFNVTEGYLCFNKPHRYWVTFLVVLYPFFLMARSENLVHKKIREVRICRASTIAEMNIAGDSWNSL